MKIVIILLLCAIAFASDEHYIHKPCNHDHVMDDYFNENPHLLEEHIAFREQMKLQANEYLKKASFSKEADALVRIPVVWQILHSSSVADSYITMTQINNEMAWLNEWYSASNTYYNDASSFWAGDIAVASDFQIEFVLASQDPNGNPTTGVVYRETSVASTCGSYSIFRQEEGGLDLWDSLQFMNIYTCGNIGGAAGYAYLPSTNTHERDGIVLLSQYVGADFITGSVLAHEVGHWLGLQHTFSGCDSVGDGVADTPPTSSPAFDYVTGGAACPGQSNMGDYDFWSCSTSTPVMIQNCMDYNYEDCKSYFSKGQVAVMRSYLDTSTSVRFGLKTSIGLSSTNTCTPSCGGNVCGSDGCGGSCGTCASTATCTNGACVNNPTSPTPSRSPQPPSSGNSLQSMRDTILSAHNNLRANVEPPAQTPLTPLVYSSVLESAAQGWVSACNFYHSSLGYGENLYAGSGDRTGDMVSLMNSVASSWESEKANYDVITNTCATNQVCGHYKQMVWNHPTYTTTQLGCYAQFCTTNSPFGPSFPTWTFVSCNYNGAGNYIGLKPYEECTTCSSTCSSTCPPGACGQITDSCGQTLDCGCCDDPCTVNECGTVLNACNEAINCGSCASGESCVAGNSGNECLSAPDCHAAECAANGIECDYMTYCGLTANCGSCTNAGQICENFECIDDPCLGCGLHSHCDNSNVCVCDDGFTPDASSPGNCIQVNSGGTATPDFSTMFTQTSPAGVAFTVPDTTIILSANGPHILNWDASADVVDVYTTTSSIDVELTSGEFGFNIRYGQGSGRNNDRIMWHIKDIGSSPKMSICLVYYGTPYCGSYYTINFPTNQANTIKVTMGHDSGTNILTTFRVNSDTTWTSYVYDGYYPTVGSISYFTSPSNGATAFLDEAVLATASVVTVSLTECIDDSEWEAMFYALTGANPATTSVQVRADGENGNCAKKSATSKVAVSSFTSVITSASVSAQSLSTILSQSTGGPIASMFGVQSITTVTGPAAAAAAGLPSSVASLGPSVIATPGLVGSGAGAAAAGGAGGAAAGGLSGGSIAGIVVGSVAGAILLAGVATLVVVGIVAVAVLASGDDEDDVVSNNSGEKRKTMRQTLRGFFGGVDVMNDPASKGHQSITARSPAVH